MKIKEVTKKDLFLSEEEERILREARHILREMADTMDWMYSDELARKMYVSDYGQNSTLVAESYESNDAAETLDDISDFIDCLLDCIEVDYDDNDK